MHAKASRKYNFNKETHRVQLNLNARGYRRLY